MNFKDIIFRDIYSIEPMGFGMDISDSSMKLASLGFAGGKMFFKGSAEFEIGDGIVSGGQIKNEDKLAEIISGAVQSSKKIINSKFVVCSLPEEKVFVRVAQIPKLVEENLPRAVLTAIEENIPMSLEDVYFDYQNIEIKNSSGHSDISIVACPKQIVDSYISVLKKSGLVPIAMEVESQAVARALLKDSENFEPVLLVDLGAHRMSLIIFSGLAARFTTTVQISGKDFEKAISEKLKVDLAEAKALKEAVGLDQTKMDGKVASALRPVADKIAEEIKKYIDFYHNHSQHEHGKAKLISRVILCGGDSNLAGLEAYLFLALKIPVELGNPWINIYGSSFKEIPEMSFSKSLAFATAIGLALRGIGKI